MLTGEKAKMKPKMKPKQQPPLIPTDCMFAGNEIYDRIILPRWVRELLMAWAERAYRRGFQQGFHMAQKRLDKYNGRNEERRAIDGSRIADWRFAIIKWSDNDGTPLSNKSSSLARRHIEIDHPGLDDNMGVRSVLTIHGWDLTQIRYARRRGSPLRWKTW
jgi:hypothetical protein